ncbi:MAG: HdeD family acid-resistance protein, partial [Parachlamydiaceae bacterium]
MNMEDKKCPLECFCGLKNLQQHWGWFLAVGVLLVILGILAIGGATFVTLASMVFFGIVLLIGGIVQGVNAVRTLHGEGFLVNALSAILYVVVGVMLMRHPAEGAITLTLILAAFYTVSGLFKMIAAVAHRYSHWGWLLFSGIISLLLGLLIWAQWPVSGLWIIGLFIGIDLIVLGWMWITLALAAKDTNLP